VLAGSQMGGRGRVRFQARLPAREERIELAPVNGLEQSGGGYRLAGRVRVCARRRQAVGQEFDWRSFGDKDERKNQTNRRRRAAERRQPLPPRRVAVLMLLRGQAEERMNGAAGGA
jgi:hypothetical protein